MKTNTITLCSGQIIKSAKINSVNKFHTMFIVPEGHPFCDSSYLFTLYREGVVSDFTDLVGDKMLVTVRTENVASIE